MRVLLPSDILIAWLCMVGLSFAVGLASAWLARRVPRAAGVALGLFAMLVLVSFALWLNNTARLATWLPLANALIWGNLQAPAAGMLAGVAAVLLPGPAWKRSILIVPLVAIGLWRLSAPLVGHAPLLGEDRWTHDGICRQTSTSTCSPAAAATLLRHHGITTSEREMASLCLTHESGTLPLGIYRGLKLKTEGTPVKPVVFAGDLASLLQQPLPALIHLRLVGGGQLPLGPRHTVLLVGAHPEGTLEIADPFTGRQTWRRHDLEGAWTDEALLLAPRH